MKRLRWLIWLLLIGLLAGWVFWQQSRPSSAPQALPDWPALSPASVAEIEIRHPGRDAVLLRKQQDGWHLLVTGSKKGEKPSGASSGEGSGPVSADGPEGPVAADDDAVRHLLTDLAAMRPVRVVSHRAEHYARLGVDAHNGTHLWLRDASGRALLDLYVGKPSTDLVSTYVRLADRSEAVTVNRSLTWQVGRLPDAWKAPERPASKDESRQP